MSAACSQQLSRPAGLRRWRPHRGDGTRTRLCRGDQCRRHLRRSRRTAGACAAGRADLLSGRHATCRPISASRWRRSGVMVITAEVYAMNPVATLPEAARRATGRWRDRGGAVLFAAHRARPSRDLVERGLDKPMRARLGRALSVRSRCRTAARCPFRAGRARRPSQRGGDDGTCLVVCARPKPVMIRNNQGIAAWLNASRGPSSRRSSS